MSKDLRDYPSQWCQLESAAYFGPADTTFSRGAVEKMVGWMPAIPLLLLVYLLYPVLPDAFDEKKTDLGVLTKKRENSKLQKN